MSSGVAWGGVSNQDSSVGEVWIFSGKYNQVCISSLKLLLTFILSYLKVIDMVKDEMVKQGKSRGTGRPGKTLK